MKERHGGRAGGKERGRREGAGMAYFPSSFRTSAPHQPPAVLSPRLSPPLLMLHLLLSSLPFYFAHSNHSSFLRVPPLPGPLRLLPAAQPVVNYSTTAFWNDKSPLKLAPTLPVLGRVLRVPWKLGEWARREKIAVNKSCLRVQMSAHKIPGGGGRSYYLVFP